MGSHWHQLRAWRDYFSEANIYGGDIDKDILKNEDRIKTFHVDQTNPSSIKSMFDRIGVKKFDVILEDGLHEYNANICFFENSINFTLNELDYSYNHRCFLSKLKIIIPEKNK